MPTASLLEYIGSRIISSLWSKASLRKYVWRCNCKENVPNSAEVLLKVSKSQKQFFLKLHCPQNIQNIWQSSAPAHKITEILVKILSYWARAEYFVHFLGNGVSIKNAFEIYWTLKQIFSNFLTMSCFPRRKQILQF